MHAPTEADPNLAVTAVAWQGCDDGFECAQVTVPLDHSDPEGPMIDLALIRLPSSSAEPIGSLFVNPGGPGTSGVEYVRATGGAHPSLHQDFHIVGFDPRGIGGSDALMCGEGFGAFDQLDPVPDDDGEQAVLDAAAKAFADSCAAQGERRLSHIGTTSVAQDLEWARQAVGDGQLNYLGFSYGTAIGLAYAELYPQQIRAMVLDGVSDPTQTLEELLLGQAIATERAMTAILDACDRSDDCPLGTPAAEAYERLARRLDDEPLATGSGPVGASQLDNAAIMSSYSPTLWSRFHSALADADRGDGRGLADMAARYSGLTSFDAYLAVTCVDAPHPVGSTDYQRFAARLAAVAPRFGASIANELLPCAYWPVEPSRTPGPVTASGAAPILVLNKTNDAATPLENARRVAANLESGRLVIHEADGHTSFGETECTTTLVLRYLVDLEVPPVGTVCDDR